MIFNEVKDPKDFWKFTMESDDVLALECALVEAGDGDYLEIGTQQGGSACFVGRVKKMLGHLGKLYGVDSLQNRFADKDKIEQHTRAEGLDFTLIVDKSDHATLPEKCHPVVTLIDGDHAYEWVKKDWERFSKITQRFVCLHDVKTHDGPKQLARELADGWDARWRWITATGNMGILERIKW